MYTASQTKWGFVNNRLKDQNFFESRLHLTLKISCSCTEINCHADDNSKKHFNRFLCTPALDEVQTNRPAFSLLLFSSTLQASCTVSFREVPSVAGGEHTNEEH